MTVGVEEAYVVEGGSRTLSSASEKPRPALTRRLYLMVGQRTIGLSLSTGRGATAAAFWMRALRRLNLRPGFRSHVSSYSVPVPRETFRWRFRVFEGIKVKVGASVPGRSVCGRGAASPCGNLLSVNITILSGVVQGESSRLFGIC